MPANVDTTERKIREFGSALESLEVRWRKTPPARVEWYKPPRRNTLPLLRYAVNPGKTMILKVMVLPTDSEGLAHISFAVFQIDGRFMYDTSVDLDDSQKATTWLRRLFTDKSVIEVAEKNGDWAGSQCRPPNGHLPAVGYAYARSWLGTYDAPEAGQ